MMTVRDRNGHCVASQSNDCANGDQRSHEWRDYVEQCLVPTLHRNDIVVMDNLRVYNRVGVREAIETARASVRYLPKYSPDLNPIDMPYSKFRALLRKFAVRTVPGLCRTIRSFVTMLDADECADHFRHAGYASI